MNAYDFSNTIYVKDLDFVMLSYDEPNADENFEDLQKIVPWAKRSHGVKGFDAAHRAAADKSETEIFVTIDADNIVDPAVLDFRIRNPKKQDNFAVALNGINLTNGLMYGNGSIKVWTRKFVYKMHCHENIENEEDATERKTTDFCWEPSYYSTRASCYSLTVTNKTPYQSWRAGFREGVKKGMQYKENFVLKRSIAISNNDHIFSWSMLGADVENGAIGSDAFVLGVMLYIGNLIPASGISDFAWLEDFYTNQWPLWAPKMETVRKSIGALFDIPSIPLLDPASSKAVKYYSNIANANTPRISEYEI